MTGNSIIIPTYYYETMEVLNHDVKDLVNVDHGVFYEIRT